MKFVLIRSCDWEGLYVDGLLRKEDHSIDMRILLDLVDGECRDLTSKQDRALSEGGGLPTKLEDIDRLSDPS